MTGSLLNPTKVGFSPEGVLPHESAKPPCTRTRTGAASPLVRPMRLKRILRGWMAAANAYRERQAVLLTSHRAGDLNSKRIYRGPIDDALERAARLRQRRRRKHS